MPFLIFAITLMASDMTFAKDPAVINETRAYENMSLKGIKAVSLTLDEINVDEKLVAAGFDTGKLKTLVVNKLRSEGINISGEYCNDCTTIMINIFAIKLPKVNGSDGFAVTVDFALNQMVIPESKLAVKLTAKKIESVSLKKDRSDDLPLSTMIVVPTWKTASMLISAGEFKNIYSSVEKDAEEFAASYLSVNPKKN